MQELPERWERILPEPRKHLTAIPGVGPKTAEKLIHKGLFSIREVAQVNPEAVEIEGIRKERLIRIVKEARKLSAMPALPQKQAKVREIRDLLGSAQEELIHQVYQQLTNARERTDKHHRARIGFATKQVLIDQIANYFSHDKLVPFIGAGFSKHIDPAIPTGSDLTKLLAKELKLRKEQWERLGPLRVAELYVQRFGKAKLVQLLQAKLQATDDKLAGSSVHIHLATLNPPRIYTTNFDCFIERVFLKTPLVRERIVTVRDLSRAIPGRTQLVKLHGSLPCFPSDECDPQNLVITESDYFRRIRERHPFEALLEADLCKRALLFIGYSFNDPNIGYLWHLLSSMPEWVNIAQSYFVVHEKQDYDPAQAEFLASKGISTIFLKQEGWTLAKFLGAIAAKVAAGRSERAKRDLRAKRDFAYRSLFSEQEPVFLTADELQRLAKAVQEGDEKQVLSSLRTLFFRVPTDFHFDYYSQLLVRILTESSSAKVKEEALQRMGEQIEIFAKDDKYQNYRIKLSDILDKMRGKFPNHEQQIAKMQQALKRDR